MAKYRQIWTTPLDNTIVGYFDTETNITIPIDGSNKDYQVFLDWQTSGGVSDPAYTSEEIAEYQSGQDVSEAEKYLQKTATIVQRYRDDIASGRQPFIPQSKYNNLLKKRARAQKLISTDFSDF